MPPFRQKRNGSVPWFRSLFQNLRRFSYFAYRLLVVYPLVWNRDLHRLYPLFTLFHSCVLNSLPSFENVLQNKQLDKNNDYFYHGTHLRRVGIFLFSVSRWKTICFDNRNPKLRLEYCLVALLKLKILKLQIKVS